MKVFISWSGQKSKQTAEILSSWIRQVIQAAETWISSDIEKGVRWNEKISKELEQTKVGIICLNKENLNSEWILFEAGALSKTNDAHVCTFLLDLTPSDIKPPLSQFQHTNFSKEEIKKLLHTINNKVLLFGEKSLPEKDLDEVFEIFWPTLEKKLKVIHLEPNANLPIQRTDRDILEEILSNVRTILKPFNEQLDLHPYILSNYLSKNWAWNNVETPNLFALSQLNANNALFQYLRSTQLNNQEQNKELENENNRDRIDDEK